MTRAEQLRAVKAAHEGTGESVESMSMSGHRGVTGTFNTLKERFYWRTVDADVKEYVFTCSKCQKVNPKWRATKPPLHPIPVPNKAFKQVGVDIASLPESDGFRSSYASTTSLNGPREEQ